MSPDISLSPKISRGRKESRTLALFYARLHLIHVLIPQLPSGLAVGAGNLIPKMVSLGIPDDGTLIVNNLTLDQWAIIANVFFDWPFKPQVCFFPVPSALGSKSSY